jgi:hypothetical protein
MNFATTLFQKVEQAMVLSIGCDTNDRQGNINFKRASNPDLPNTVLEILFPLDKFLLILDNLNRQQVIDLFALISGKSSLNEFAAKEEDAMMFYNQHINHYDRCQAWVGPSATESSDS